MADPDTRRPSPCLAINRFTTALGRSPMVSPPADGHESYERGARVVNVDARRKDEPG